MRSQKLRQWEAGLGLSGPLSVSMFVVETPSGQAGVNDGIKERRQDCRVLAPQANS